MPSKQGRWASFPENDFQGDQFSWLLVSNGENKACKVGKFVHAMHIHEN